MSEHPDRHVRHAPVLEEEVRRLAECKRNQVWADCTVGAGGHTQGLLEAGATVYGIDRDPNALALCAERFAEADYRERLNLVRGNFGDVGQLVPAPLDGLLADLGVSSMQLDEPARGFAFRSAGPVDMRMDPDTECTALDLIRKSDEGSLANILRRFGELRGAEPRRVALAIMRWAAGPGEKTTQALAAAIGAALPRHRDRGQRTHHPATRAFQALRMAVNDELSALQSLLLAIPVLMAPGGRVLIISFHSLEDRLVKTTFAGLSQPKAPPRRGLPPSDAPPPAFERLTRRAVRPSADELARNPRARSARLRAVRHLEAA